MVSTAATKLSSYTGTYISHTFITRCLSSWQAHLMRISSYLKHGKSLWWKSEENGIRFLDSVNDPAYQNVRPKLLHFRENTLPDVYRQASQDWNIIQQHKVTLPSTSIRLYNANGGFETTTSEFSAEPPFPQFTATMEVTPQTAQASFTSVASTCTTMEIAPQTAQASLTSVASTCTTMEVAPQTAQASVTSVASTCTTMEYTLRHPRPVLLQLHLHALQWRLPLRQPRPVLLQLRLHALQWRLPLRHPRPVLLQLDLCALEWRRLLFKQTRPVNLYRHITMYYYQQTCFSVYNALLIQALNVNRT